MAPDGPIELHVAYRDWKVKATTEYSIYDSCGSMIHKRIDRIVKYNDIHYAYDGLCTLAYNLYIRFTEV